MRWRCRSYQSQLVDYADGILDDARRPRLDRHLAGCADCRREVAALGEVPTLLHTSLVPDPGEAFWLHQRQAIGRAVRNLPEPSSRWSLDWLRAALQRPAWRYPVAAAVSLVVAVLIYRFATEEPAPHPGALSMQLATLDADAVLALREIAQAVAPADQELSRASADDDTLLASLPLDEMLGVSESADAPSATDLSDAELQGIGDLIGGVG